MAVRGLDLFSERFSEFRDALILIGGAACDLWFGDQNLEFRTTKDLDIVLVLERLAAAPSRTKEADCCGRFLTIVARVAARYSWFP